jgi:hypothetical protein
VSRCAKLYDVLFHYRELCGLELAAHFKHYAYDLTAIDSAMGKSRSATLVMAYLMRKYHISPTKPSLNCVKAVPYVDPTTASWSSLKSTTVCSKHQIPSEHSLSTSTGFTMNGLGLLVELAKGPQSCSMAISECGKLG